MTASIDTGLESAQHIFALGEDVAVFGPEFRGSIDAVGDDRPIVVDPALTTSHELDAVALGTVDIDGDCVRELMVEHASDGPADAVVVGFTAQMIGPSVVDLDGDARDDVVVGRVRYVSTTGD